MVTGNYNYLIPTPSVLTLLFFSVIMPFILTGINLWIFYYMIKNRQNYWKFRNGVFAFLIVLLMTYPLRIVARTLTLSEMVLATETESDYIGTIISALGYGELFWSAVLYQNMYPVMALPFAILYLSVIFFRRKIKRRHLIR